MINIQEFDRDNTTSYQSQNTFQYNIIKYKKVQYKKHFFLMGDLHIVEGTKAALDRELVRFAATENQPMAV